MLRSLAWSGLVAMTFLASVKAADPARLGVETDKKDPPAPGRIEVENCNNDAWKVQVSVDKPDATYRLGDEVFIKVTSDQPGYLFVFNVDPTGNITMLFPNQFQQDNAIQASTPVTVPDPNNQKFRIRATPPGGREMVKAIVTKDPLRECEAKDYATRSVTPVSRLKFVRLATEAMGGEPAKVEVQPLPPPGQGPVKPDQKPDVVIQKQKVEKERPEIFKKKKKEWATGQIEINVIPGKGKPTQGQVPTKPDPVPTKPIQGQVPPKPIQGQVPPKPDPVPPKPTQGQVPPKPDPVPPKPTQGQVPPKPIQGQVPPKPDQVPPKVPQTPQVP
jgi:hypothetical protein